MTDFNVKNAERTHCKTCVKKFQLMTQSYSKIYRRNVFLNKLGEFIFIFRIRASIISSFLLMLEFTVV